jgi:hypothetical protein
MTSVYYSYYNRKLAYLSAIMGNCLSTEEFLPFKIWTSEIDIFVAIQLQIPD